jgi:hypothetical protein
MVSWAPRSNNSRANSSSYDTWHASILLLIWHMACMYPPPHMTRDMHVSSSSYDTWHACILLLMWHMTCMYPPPHMTHDMPVSSSSTQAFSETFDRYRASRSVLYKCVLYKCALYRIVPCSLETLDRYRASRSGTNAQKYFCISSLKVLDRFSINVIPIRPIMPTMV